MVENSNFKIKIPTLNPLSLDYKNFWRDERRKCIEGYWVGGKYMPGPVYQYINHWKIELNKTKNSKQKVIDHPFLRDLEWEKGRLFLEARGFSGFEFDTKYTCNREYKDTQIFWDNFENKRVFPITEDDFLLIGSNSKRYSEIKYVPAREYLSWNHSKDLGRPLMENQSKNVVDVESRGCLAKGTKVLLFNGSSKNAEDIIQGDLLMGKDSTPRKVEWIHSGKSKMYRIKSTKYEDLVVNENHQLSVKYIKFNKKGNKEVETSFQIKELLEKQKQSSFRNRYYRYIPSKGIDYNYGNYQDIKLNIDPYYLGLWLADGRSNCTSIKITDDIIWKYLDIFTKDLNTRIIIGESEVNRKEWKEYYIQDDNFRKQFNDYKLLNNKHIPKDYFICSKEDRIKLLEGLIDGDGRYDKKTNSFDIYCGLNEKLADDIVLIARSLGLYSNKTIRNRKDYKQTYEVIISGNIEILYPIIERKQPLNTIRRKDPIRSSFNIEYEGEGEFYGFHVDNDNEYLLADFTVDHNTGKSFFASNLIAWNFLHDGVFWYEELSDKPKSETLIGAIDTKYSSGLIKKVKLGLENLTGGIEFGDKYYPPPFLKKYSGSWESSKTITAEYDRKIGDSWVKAGSKSMIYHRSFADNPMAANGTRPGFSCLEEVGFMGNLREALGQLKECTHNGSNKFGTIWMFGTGGDMAGGSTEAVKDVFYNPDAYDCLIFEDEFENKGKIGYFVPAWKGLNDFKDSEGITNHELASNYLIREREKLKNSKSKQALYDELQNRPIVPSEAFLVLTGNIFPVAELKEHQAFLETNDKTKNLGTIGLMQRDKDGKVYFKTDDDRIPCDYPTKTSQDSNGAVVIWEEPIDNPPYGLYIAGIDPYDQDKAPNSASLGSIIIYKRFIDADQTYHLPVAEYTARPEFANDFYEQCRRLLEWYNARALYENEKTGLKSYFETKHCLHLLHRQPSIINKITPNTKVDRTYGTHMNIQIKEQIEIFTRDWLKTELSPGIMQLTKINSIPLLKELISYNSEGNFDRVIAFMLIIMQDLDMHAVTVEEAREDLDIDPFFERKLFR